MNTNMQCNSYKYIPRRGVRVSECLGRSNNLFSDKAPAGNDVHTTGGGACRALTVLPSAICICGRARHVSQVPRNVLDLPLVELVRLGVVTLPGVSFLSLDPGRMKSERLFRSFLGEMSLSPSRLSDNRLSLLRRLGFRGEHDLAGDELRELWAEL